MKTTGAPILILAAFLAFACNKDDETSEEVPAVYKKIYGATDIYIEGDYVVIKAQGFPDHKSPYFKATEWEATMWINDTRPSFQQAPNNKVSKFNYTFKIPKNPHEASVKKTLGTATIGIGVNGVPLFNQYAAGNVAITTASNEYLSFDLYNGHPTPFHEYHYHIEPTYVTANKGKDALIGFLLDGFPVYGPLEGGKTLISSDLDAYHGHFGVTADYPSGIYHYHTTDDTPYINGNGYYGTAGTWTK